MFQREENIPWRLTRENDAIFCLTVHNIKISRWDGKEVSEKFASSMVVCGSNSEVKSAVLVLNH